MADESINPPDTTIDIATKLAQPQLVALLFCDWANATTDNKYNLIGTFDHITVPLDHRRTPLFTIYIKAARIVGEPLRLRAFAPDGTLILEGIFEAAAINTAVTAEQHLYIQFVTRVQFDAEIAGIYWFDVVYRGQAQGGAALTVEFGEREEVAEDDASA